MAIENAAPLPTTRTIHSVYATKRRGAPRVLLGANGAGKSTTLRVFCGVLNPEAVRIDGASPSDDPLVLERRIGGPRFCTSSSFWGETNASQRRIQERHIECGTSQVDCGNSRPSELKITDMRIAVLSQNRGQGGGGGRGGRPVNARTGGQAYSGAAPGMGGVVGGQILVRFDTNQGISGYGEMYNGGITPYALILKSRILGENPCRVARHGRHSP